MRREGAALTATAASSRAVGECSFIPELDRGVGVSVEDEREEKR